MSVLVHFNNFKFDEDIVSNEDGFVGMTYTVDVKMGRTVIPFSALVKPFEDNDGSMTCYVEGVFCDDEEKLLDKLDKYGIKVQNFIGVVKHSIREMFCKNKDKYVFRIC